MTITAVVGVIAVATLICMIALCWLANGDSESPAESNLPQPDLSSNSHVPSRLPTPDGHKYQREVDMAQEAFATNAKKQSDEGTTGIEALSSAPFAAQGEY